MDAREFSGVHSTLKSYDPVSPVLSTTVWPVNRENKVARVVMEIWFETIRPIRNLLPEASESGIASRSFGPFFPITSATYESSFCSR